MFAGPGFVHTLEVVDRQPREAKKFDRPFSCEWLRGQQGSQSPQADADVLTSEVMANARTYRPTKTLTQLFQEGVSL
jgi:hypothetical protein